MVPKQMMPVLLKRLAELGSIVERPLLACKLTDLLQAVLEWDQVKVRHARNEASLSS